MIDSGQAGLLPELKQRIEDAGGIPFADFMEQALYHPLYGYYMKPRTRIGKGGDFFTSSSVHSCFGQLIARQLEQMWQLLGKGPFVIAEQGAGAGYLALDILNACENFAPEFYAALRYRIVEISSDSQLHQAELLHQHIDADRVDWCELADLKGMKGCFLSNELVDSLPVHLVEKREGTLWEVYVINSGDGFSDELRPLSTERIQEYFERLGLEPLEGNRCEVNLAALDWMAQVAEIVKRGFVMTIDYGYAAKDLYAPSRHTGSLLCYYQHQANEEPYRRVGQQDMTAHIDFTSLQQVAGKWGLKTLYFGHQYQFLMALGFLDLLTEMQSRETDATKAQELRMKMKNLILPEGGMGESFKVLIQGKHVGMPELLCSKRIQDLAPPML